MSSERAHPNYVAIWLWLVVLMIAGVAASSLPLGKGAVIALIFAIAATKAVLVALNYMHLKFETSLIYAIAIVPIVLVLAMTLILFPDFVFRR